jgi:acyl-CoA dehydrogenase
VDFDLDSQLKQLQDQARALAVASEPFAVAADNSSDLNRDVHLALKKSGLARVAVSKAHGGRFETVDPLAICVVREQLAAVSSQLDALFAMQGIGSYAITLAGSTLQRDRWLPEVATAKSLAALAITEPEAGSDLRSITTRVTPKPDGWALNGSKSFISNGGVAAFYVTLAREADGFSLFLVNGQSGGLMIQPTPELISPHLLGELTFSNVALRPEDRIGEPGRGLEYVLATLAVFRASVGAAAVGMSQRALDVAVNHAMKRHQFGKPIARHGAVAAMLADSWTQVEMARLLVYRSAWEARRGPGEALVQASMAKLAATEMACEVIDRCLQVMGRFGLIRDSQLERLYRRARPLRIYEGTSEVLRMGIARSLTESSNR